MRRPISLLPSSLKLPRVKEMGSSHLINWYVDFIPNIDENKMQIIYRPVPGYELWLDVKSDGGEVRGAFEHKGIGYVVIDNRLYSITPNKTQTLLGTLNSLRGHVWITALSDEIVISDDTDAYSYIISTNNFAEITTGTLPSPVGCVISANQRIFYQIRNTQEWYLSNLEDARTVSATASFQTEFQADDALAGIVHENNIYLFGTNTLEIWEPSGSGAVPFDRMAGGVMHIGIAAKRTAKRVLNTIFFLGRDENGQLGAMQITGMNIAFVPNQDFFVETISEYQNIDDAFAWVWEVGGKHFWNITFPTAETSRGRTWSYNPKTQSWHELESWYDDYGFVTSLDRYRANCSLKLGRTQLIGDRRSGKLFVVSADIYKELSNEIHREVIGPNINKAGIKFSISDIVIRVERGQGLNGDVKGTDPILEFCYSKDCGRTYSNFIPLKIGKIGEYQKEIKIGSAGSASNFMIKMRCSDPVNITIIDVSAVMKAGSV